MKIGVNVPNYGPGTDPGMLRDWAQTVEGLGFDLLMTSDHVVVTPDVAARYPAPFFEPFTTLSWLAGATRRVLLGTTVLILAYRHPLLTARMAANLADLSGGRFILGVGVGWAKQEFEALGVPYERRGKLTDDHLHAVRAAWRHEGDYGHNRIPIWIGGSSGAALRRSVRLGDAWHPLRCTASWLRDAVSRLNTVAAQEDLPVPGLAPRIVLRPTAEPLADPDRLMGEGDLDQIIGDLTVLRTLGAEAVLLDTFGGDPEELRHPETAWRDLATVAASWKENR
ncbi:MAG: LLM class flavin-dependent oxidoreductase [Kutzneria sp.]|nr:LLM class flavin-dependent oxidoreductase [Kutzneria sp.]MBV9845468.1 LLM class flavin-dependent oxidoreductase [Kutzneria sp.]